MIPSNLHDISDTELTFLGVTQQIPKPKHTRHTDT